MNTPASRSLHWAPRILALLLAGFISLFALDVFAEGYSFWETIVGLTMHLIPTFALLIALAIAWRRERAGGLAFIALGALSLIVFRPSGWLATLLLAGLPALIGVLFLFSSTAQGRKEGV